MGGKSFKQSEKEELAFSVVTSFLEDSYYESKSKRTQRIAQLVKEISEKDALFVAKLAIVTRREFHMRSAFHVLLGELVKNHNGDSLVRNTIAQGVERPDDLLEIAAYIGKKPLPNQVKKGFSQAIHKFNPYQLAKYRGEDKKFSLVDMFNLAHPRTLDSNQKVAWKKLLNNELKNTQTWESKLSSEKGRENKSETWTQLIKEDKLGYMALLRNLRNIAQECDSETVALAARKIVNPEAIRASKQLPFRFISAYEALSGVERDDRGRFKSRIQFEKDGDNFEVLAEAVNKAISISCQNIPELPGKTVILTDNSGSMRGDSGGDSLVSVHSHRTSSDIANLFATMYWMRAENTYVGVFGDHLLQPRLDREKTLFENYKIIDAVGRGIGGATEHGAFEAFQEMIAKDVRPDRVIIFTDCQLGDSKNTFYGKTAVEAHGNFNALFQKLKQQSPRTLFYNVDLKGHGTTLYSDGIVELAGWSDKIFELMESIEKKEGLVKWIEQYPIQLL